MLKRPTDTATCGFMTCVKFNALNRLGVFRSGNSAPCSESRAPAKADVAKTDLHVRVHRQARPGDLARSLVR